MQIEVKVNGNIMKMEVENNEMLLDALRKYGFFSIKKGCDTTSCGLCTIWLEGKPILSCSTLAVKANGKNVTTLEGVQNEAEEFGTFLVNEGAEQCGFCSPGLIMTVLAMKRELSNPSEEDIKHYLAGNLCRCTGYMGQLRAIKKYMGVK
ncbi:2Fe-2S iron-sulfur cluster-binding protein [Clostridium sediminicola]|uniref:(2Fe-2S)-binding protein n=1 Tax=Clostridium sediminicola TaxID=3114879 RepID=UPI0031F1DED4